MSDEELTDEELEEIQRRKMLQYQQMAAEAQRRAELQRQMELAKQSLLRQILTPEARSRLANIKMVRPEFAEQLEAQLIQLAQAGRLRIPVTDEVLKEVLKNIQLRAKRDWRIQRV
ncbi:MAG: DNA-binding protein [Thermoprotei archaeon]|nr:MAG: DNA-binding protein [Thermoprotei archaeon]RLF18611.1 MAG: DNA-binding protein [Thermoprotei archaeon]